MRTLTPTRLAAMDNAEFASWAIHVVTGQLTTKQLTALTDASREIQIANQCYGLSSQVTANNENGKLIAAIVLRLGDFGIGEISEKLRGSK